MAHRTMVAAWLPVSCKFCNQLYFAATQCNLPILFYFAHIRIEMQQDNKEWLEIATVVDSLAYTVKNLSAESMYKFRVRAENIHGRSEPSASSDEVTTKKIALVKGMCSLCETEGQERN